MKSSALLLLSAVSMLAQPTYEIRGTVSEVGFGGLGGVRVSATDGFPDDSSSLVNSTFTNARGEFSLHLQRHGTYFLRTALAGYRTLTGSIVEISAARQTANAAVLMYRPGEVTGRVVDVDTLSPLEGVSIATVPLGSRTVPARISGLPNQKLRRETSSSLADGGFSQSNLAPGTYAPVLLDQTFAQMTSGPTENEYEGTEEALELVNPEASVHVASGGIANLGNLLVRRAPRFRVRLSMAQSECPLNQKVNLSIYGNGAGQQDFLLENEFLCGSDVLIHALPPGSYLVYAVTAQQGERSDLENVIWGRGDFSVSDENTSAALIMKRGIVIQGWGTVPEGAKPPELYSLYAQSRDLSAGIHAPAEFFMEWQREGRFRMAVAPWRQTLDARAPGWYLKELRVAGSPVAGRIVPPQSLAPTQELELVFDNHFGAIEGKLEGAGEVYLLLEWPSGEIETQRPSIAGTFRFQNIPPGEYRIRAVPADPMYPLSWSTIGGQKVTIRPDETKTLTLPISTN